VATLNIHPASNKDPSHILCIHYQPEANIFQIIDPNYGLFQFASADQFLDCFSDLINTTYHWANNFKLSCFDVNTN
jgi:hypothetical protein